MKYLLDSLSQKMVSGHYRANFMALLVPRTDVGLQINFGKINYSTDN